MSKDESVIDDSKVVISAKDCGNALDFWKHFNIPIPSELQKAMDAFAKNPNFSNQERVKYEVCKAISTSDHAAFKDDYFSKIVEECAAVAYSMTFDRDLENTLSEDK
jgi:hypothetical protein